MQYIPGIDVSHWQAQIDWPAVRAAGKRYAFIKATEGTSFVDDTFERNWEQAKQAGLLVGAYHFFRPLQDAQNQAEHFLNTADFGEGDLPPVLDMEVNNRLRPSTYIERVEIWMDEVERQTGKKAIIYSGVSFLNGNFTIAAGGPPFFFGGPDTRNCARIASTSENCCADARRTTAASSKARPERLPLTARRTSSHSAIM